MGRQNEDFQLVGVPLQMYLDKTHRDIQQPEKLVQDHLAFGHHWLLLSDRPLESRQSRLLTFHREDPVEHQVQSIFLEVECPFSDANGTNSLLLLGSRLEEHPDRIMGRKD